MIENFRLTTSGVDGVRLQGDGRSFRSVSAWSSDEEPRALATWRDTERRTLQIEKMHSHDDVIRTQSR